MNAAAATGVGAGPDVLATAAGLRWARPDLTRALAEHVLEGAEATGDADTWLAAAGWRVHASHAVGDGREAAAEVLGQLRGWGEDVLRRPAAARLRVELAVVVHDAGEPDAARTLLAPPSPVADAELVADRAVALARCAVDDGLDTAVEAAVAAWDRAPADRAGVGGASALLVAAAADRRRARAEDAVSRAVGGLTRLDRTRGPAGGPTPSGHLAAALAAEWIAALVDARRVGQARDVIGPLQARLAERTRPTRQLAHLRLTIARVLATRDDGDAAEELDRAARDAATADVPDLEHVCRVALGEIHEARGKVEAALEAVRLAVMADRRHRARAARLREALAAAHDLLPDATAPVPDRDGEGNATERTAVLGAVRRRERNGEGGPWSTGSWAPVGGRRGNGRAVPSAPDRGGAGTPTTGGAAPGAPGSSGVAAGGAVSGGPRSGGAVPGDTGTGAASSGGAAPGHAGAGAASSGDTGPAAAASGSTASGAPVVGGSGTGAGADPTARTAVMRSHSPDGNRAEETGRARDTRSTTGSRHRRAAEETATDVPASAGASGSGLDPAPTTRAIDEPAHAGRPRGGSTEQPAPQETAAAAEGAADALHTADPVAGTGATDRSGRAGAASRATSGSDPSAGRQDRAVPAETAALRMPPSDLDPEAWLTAALAELDRIWNEPADGGGTPGDDRPVSGDPDPAADGCVVVLDLARSGDRLPDDAAADTMRAVAARLADRMPPSSRLRVDGPGAVSVVMPGSDRAAASEWMRAVVPGLVEGLAADGTVRGALLRGSVHGTDGVVGAQVLQRLEHPSPGTEDPVSGPRHSRPAGAGRASAAGRARTLRFLQSADGADAGPRDGAARNGGRRGTDDGRGTGERSSADPATSRVRSARTVADRAGWRAAGDRATTRDRGRPSSEDGAGQPWNVAGDGDRLARRTGAEYAGSDVPVRGGAGETSDDVGGRAGRAGAVPGDDSDRAEPARGRAADITGAGGGRAEPGGRRGGTAAEGEDGPVGRPGRGKDEERVGTRSERPDAAAAGVPDRSVTERLDTVGPPPSERAVAVDRRPYLPDGVVVRPGSGGRRYRSASDGTQPPSARDGSAEPAAGGRNGRGTGPHPAPDADGAASAGSGTAAAPATDGPGAAAGSATGVAGRPRRAGTEPAERRRSTPVSAGSTSAAAGGVTETGPRGGPEPVSRPGTGPASAPDRVDPLGAGPADAAAGAPGPVSDRGDALDPLGSGPAHAAGLEPDGAEPVSDSVPGAASGGAEPERGAAGSGAAGADGSTAAEEREPAAAEAGRAEPEGTDGLGLADLLAGALAAYRRI